jgi:hypothetical protein
VRSFLWLGSICGTRVCCAGVGISVSAGGTRGEDIVQNDKGWQLSWRRPLQAELRRQFPLVSRTRRYSPSFQGSMSPPLAVILYDMPLPVGWQVATAW